MKLFIRTQFLEVVGRRLCLMLVTVDGSRDAPHVGAAHLLVVTVVIVGRSPLRTLLAPPLAAVDALPRTLDGDVRRYLPAVAWGHLPTSWKKTESGCLTTGGILGGDAAYLLGGLLENVTVLALAWVPCVAFRSCPLIPRASLSGGSARRPHRHNGGWGEKSIGGGGAIVVVEGSVASLCRLVPT
jgi:hypothetical protein